MIRHHSLFAPRDFDISPYFQIVKPTLEGAFDYRTLPWDDVELVSKARRSHLAHAGSESLAGEKLRVQCS